MITSSPRRIPLMLPATLAAEAQARGWERIRVDQGGAEMLTDLYASPVKGLPPSGWSGGRTLGGQEWGMEVNPAVRPQVWRGTPWVPGVVETMHRSDPVMRAIGSTWGLHLQQIQMEVVPGGEGTRDLQVAGFIRACLWEYMQGGWDGWMESAASYPWRTPGLWTFGLRADATAGRAHGIDGPAVVPDRWNRLLPATLQRWIPDGGRWGIVQWPDLGDRGKGEPRPSGGEIIPAASLMHLRWDPTGDAPEGTSLYRPCWYPYQLRQTVGPLLGVAAERGAHAVPVARPGVGANSADVPLVMAALQNFRAGAYSALAIPAEGWEIEFPRIETVMDQLLAVYTMAAKEMALGTLVPWMMTGQDNGTEALIRGQFDPYVLAISQAARNIAREWSDGPNAKIKQWVDLNYSGVTRYPTLRYTPLVMAGAKDLLAMVTGAAASGVLTPGADVEEWVRGKIGLPSQPTAPEWEHKTRQPKQAPEVGEPVAPSQKERTERREDALNPAPSGEVMAETPGFRHLPGWWEPGMLMDTLGGRPIRPEEGMLRLSEVKETPQTLKDRAQAVMTAWFRREGETYVRRVMEKPTLGAARQVWVPGRKNLTEDLQALYLEGWRGGADSLTREIRRALRSPRLRAALEKGEPRKVSLGEAPHTHPHLSLSEESVVALKSASPAKAARGVGGSTADALAGRLQDLILGELQAKTRAGDIGGLSPEEHANVLTLLLETVMKASPGWEMDSANKDVNALFGMGRSQAILANAANLGGAVYSNALESHVCPECAARDGTAVPLSDVPAWSTPASWCQGGDRCQCLLFFLPSSDMKPEDIEFPPEV